MTLEEKDLLLKDLCTSLPYGVLCKSGNEVLPLKDVYIDGAVGNKGQLKLSKCKYGGIYSSIDEVRPYLRPMSSMTKDEEKELGNYLSTEVFLSIDGLHSVLRAQRHTSNFLYSRHFDILGLIEKGLALEAPENMYK